MSRRMAEFCVPCNKLQWLPEICRASYISRTSYGATIFYQSSAIIQIVHSGLQVILLTVEHGVWRSFFVFVPSSVHYHNRYSCSGATMRPALSPSVTAFRQRSNGSIQPPYTRIQQLVHVHIKSSPVKQSLVTISRMLRQFSQTS
jgi:hypothetical protein